MQRSVRLIPQCTNVIDYLHNFYSFCSFDQYGRYYLVVGFPLCSWSMEPGFHPV